MEFFRKINLLLIGGIIITSCSSTNPYPEIESLTESDIYTVEVNKKTIWTEKFVSDMDTSKLPGWFSESYVREPQEVHIASFSCEGKQNIKIKIDGDFENVSVRPKSRGIKPEINDGVISFSIEGPDYLYVEVDDRPPLFFFADPVEAEKFDPEDSDVIYFGPGVHHAGYIQLKDNQTLYIAAGAIVYGGIRAEDATNIKVRGRGILDGDFEFRRMVLIENCENVSVEGISIRYGNSWTNTIINCRDVNYKNIKVISFGPGGDGINPLGTQRMTISECFLRCTDDCIAIKSPKYDHIVEDILVENNTMLGYSYSDGITIGFETNGPYIKNVIVRNCDILMARGGSMVEGGHSGFSIICDGPAEISDILFEEIRVEKSENKLFELHISYGGNYGIDPPGHIQNVKLRNISWSHEGPIVLKGFDSTHIVKDIIFENCYVNGKLLESLDSEMFDINEFVENIRF